MKKTKEPENLTEMRIIMSKNFADLNDDVLELKKARELFNAAGKITKTVAVQEIALARIGSKEIIPYSK